ncbi:MULTISPECIES: hypothetical protein [unclassified Paenibacillus]|uniref:hypothetical protein n=1 Tax=unclassified Paenibacillus TaxID=185978 RepID=UPI001AE398AC|nr:MULTISPECIES: hypothetical protein [unclassified Paenibacillus]MBP1155700.1 Flp pilus assembly protein TadD [Paenibacillus sp. PvP091]MBP1168914.1 Flp pilus assembly protein TadD [Paenibacillus sp. PvR098]MBP2439942.1 Flp pilus assembly protein TadD [Paenibacillus sp. PvP052]
MKKIVVQALVLMMVFILAACGGENDAMTDNTRMEQQSATSIESAQAETEDTKEDELVPD